MSSENIIPIVVVGHIDHGKSTLIGRLLFETGSVTHDRIQEVEKICKEQNRRFEYAFLMDQLKEERDRNITVDTSQTQLTIEQKKYLLIDAPGHKEYLKNMITGATQAQNALLLLDIKEGIQEQTSKHAQILNLIGISNVAVIVNKMDLIGFDEKIFRKAEKDITHVLQTFKINPKAIIPISAYEGENISESSQKMTWFAGLSVLQFIQSFQEKTRESLNSSAYFPIQLAYELNNKQFLLGRVEMGKLTVGDKYQVFPSQETITISNIDKYNEDLSYADKNESIAIRINETTPLSRGNILYKTNEKIVQMPQFSSYTFWMGNSALKVGDEVLCECRTQIARCNVKSISNTLDSSPMMEIPPGEVALVEWQAMTPLLIDTGGASSPMGRVVFSKKDEVNGCGVIKEIRRNLK